MAETSEGILQANEDARDAWQGSGWYQVGWSDGGKYTDNGPVWIEDVDELADLIDGAYRGANETHLPWTERLGYEVIVDYADERTSEILLHEGYETEEAALVRLEEISEEGGWGEGTRVTAWQILDADTAASIGMAYL
jgi:hypothetical protein